MKNLTEEQSKTLIDNLWALLDLAVPAAENVKNGVKFLDSIEEEMTEVKNLLRSNIDALRALDAPQEVLTEGINLHERISSAVNAIVNARALFITASVLITDKEHSKAHGREAKKEGGGDVPAQDDQAKQG